MEKIAFQDPETNEALEFFVLEKLMLQGVEYLLVTEEEESKDGEGTAYVLKKTGEPDPDQESYEFVEDDAVLDAVAPLFSELLEDTKVQ